jgi:phage shock protein A
MWSKLGKHIFGLFNEKKEQQPLSPEEQAKQMVAIATAELHEAIKKHELTLQQTRNNQQDILKQLQQHKQNAEKLYTEATQAVKKRQDLQAQQLLDQKSHEDKQVEQYQGLFNTITPVVKQLENQLAKMKWQLQEVKSKEVIMAAKMQNAKTQTELNEYLTELDATFGGDLATELLKTELEADIINGISESDKVLANTEGQFLLQQQLQQLDKEIKEKEEQERKTREENQLKRIEQVFGKLSDQERKQLAEQQKAEKDKRKNLEQQVFNNPKEKELLAQKEKATKQQLLEQWLAENHENQMPKTEKIDKIEKTENNATKQNLLDSFFNAPTPPEKIIKNDSEKDNNKDLQNNNKQKLLDDFFNQ